MQIFIWIHTDVYTLRLHRILSGSIHHVRLWGLAEGRCSEYHSLDDLLWFCMYLPWRELFGPVIGYQVFTHQH